MMEEIKPATLSKAFVTGGSGFLGRHLIRRLRGDDIKCVAIARSVRAGQLVETAGAEAVMGDVLDAEALARGMAGCDVVFHCAWQGLDMRQPLEAIWPVNVGGTQEVARAAAQAGVRRLVFVSTEAVFFGHPIVMLDETVPLPDDDAPAPFSGGSNSYTLTKRAAERWLLGSEAPAGLEVVIVRPRLIWGDDDPGTGKQLVTFGRNGMLALLGWGDPLSSTAHVENVCEGLLCAALGGPSREIYYITDGEPQRFKAFVTALVTATSGKAPLLGVGRVPLCVVSPMADACAWLEKISGGKLRLPLAPMMLVSFGREVSVRDAKARRVLGYKNAISVRAGLDGVAARRVHAEQRRAQEMRERLEQAQQAREDSKEE